MVTSATSCSVASAITMPLEVILTKVQNFQEAATAYRIGEVGGHIDGLFFHIRQKEAEHSRLQDIWKRLCSGCNPGLLDWLPHLQESAGRNTLSLQGWRAEVQQALQELQNLAALLGRYAAQHAVVAQELQSCQNASLAWDKGMLAVLERQLARRALAIAEDCSQASLIPFAQVLEELGFSSWVQQSQVGTQVQIQPAAPVEATAQAWSACGQQGPQLPLAGMSGYTQFTTCPASARQGLQTSLIQTPHTWPAEQRWPLQASHGHTAGGSGHADDPYTPLQQPLVVAGGPSQFALRQEGLMGSTFNAQPGRQVSARVAQQAPKAGLSSLGGQGAHAQDARTAAGNSCVLPPALLGAASLQEHSRQVGIACGTGTAWHELSAGLLGTFSQGNNLLPQHAPRGPSMLSEDNKAGKSPPICLPGSPRKIAAQGVDSLPSQAMGVQGATDGLRGSSAAVPHQQSKHGGVGFTTSQHELLVAAPVSIPAEVLSGQQQGVLASIGGSRGLDEASNMHSMVPLPSGQAIHASQLAGQLPPLQQLSEGGCPAGRLSPAGGCMPNGQALPGPNHGELRAREHEEDAVVEEVHLAFVAGNKALRDRSEHQVVRLTARSPAVRGDAAPSTSTEASLSPTHATGDTCNPIPAHMAAGATGAGSGEGGANAPAAGPHPVSEAHMNIKTPQSISLRPLMGVPCTTVGTQSPLAPAGPLFTFQSPGVVVAETGVVQPTPTLAPNDSQQQIDSQQAARDARIDRLQSQEDTLLGSGEATVSATTQSTPSPGAARAAFVLMTSQLDSNSPSKKGVQRGVPNGATKLAGSQGGSQVGGSQVGGSQVGGSQVGGSQVGGSQGPPAQPLSFLQPPDQTELGCTVPTSAAQLGTGLPHIVTIASRPQQQAEHNDQGIGEVRMNEPADEPCLPLANCESRPDSGEEKLQTERENEGQGSGHVDGRCAMSQPAGTLPGSQTGGGAQLGSVGMQLAGQQVHKQQQATPTACSTETQSVPLQPAEKLALHGFSRFGRMQDRQMGLAMRQAMEAPPPAPADPCSGPAVTWEAVEHVSDTTAEEGLSDPIDRQISNMTAEGDLSVPSTSALPDLQQSQPGGVDGTQAALQTSQQHPGQQAHHGANLKRARTSPSGTPGVPEDREKRARLDDGGGAGRALMVPAAGEACTMPAMLTTQPEGGCGLGKQAGRGHPSSVENSSEEQDLSLTPQLQPSLHPPQPAGPVAAVGHATLRWGTPAIVGPAGRKLADQPSPWNTPIIAPPTSASLTAEEGGSASQDPPGLGDSGRKAWQEGCTQRIYGSLPTPFVSYQDPSPGVRCSRTEQANRRHSSQPSCWHLQPHAQQAEDRAQFAAAPCHVEGASQRILQQSCSQAACSHDGRNHASQPSQPLQQAAIRSLADAPEVHPESQLGSWPEPETMPVTQQLTRGLGGALMSASQ